MQTLHVSLKFREIAVAIGKSSIQKSDSVGTSNGLRKLHEAFRWLRKYMLRYSGVPAKIVRVDHLRDRRQIRHRRTVNSIFNSGIQVWNLNACIMQHRDLTTGDAKLICHSKDAIFVCACDSDVIHEQRVCLSQQFRIGREDFILEYVFPFRFRQP